ncbi:MAG: hypothetical protein J3R72DRAFT_443607 [Linnemannia gamsii]|nr:MAG: hypothetical protein J3R72DRAFT_443607 [Linnemannia gamsii]
MLFLVAVLGWLWVSMDAVVTRGDNIRRKPAVFLVFLDWMMNENKGETARCWLSARLGSNTPKVSMVVVVVFSPWLPCGNEE